MDRMDPTSATLDAFLVIRVWYEPGHPAGFRARLLGINRDDPATSLVLSNPDDIVAAVREWLNAVNTGP